MKTHIIKLLITTLLIVNVGYSQTYTSVPFDTGTSNLSSLADGQTLTMTIEELKRRSKAAKTNTYDNANKAWKEHCLAKNEDKIPKYKYDAPPTVEKLAQDFGTQVVVEEDGSKCIYFKVKECGILDTGKKPDVKFSNNGGSYSAELLFNTPPPCECETILRRICYAEGQTTSTSTTVGKPITTKE